ncbi:hypothetical protein [Streptomyces sp. NPDC101455]|uniref:hypothetical protein n=1 Tax=Streptomyces sp. NPDC101455 TaxID=3366142 RepID=UPI0037F92DEC
MIAVVVTVALAFAGYVITYLNGLRLTQRQERLARVNRQLGDFYGPLLAPTEANARTFAAFVEQHARPGGISPFSGGTPPTDEELAEWRLWVTTVFLPVLREMRDLVVGWADLLREPEMPSLLMELCAHAAGYEMDNATWNLVGTIDVPTAAATQDVGLTQTSHASGTTGEADFDGFTTTP